MFIILKLRLSKECKRDLKKFPLIPALIEVLYCLLNEQPLPEKYRDHAFIGNLKGYRDCHVRPDLALIYKIKNGELVLLRLNSHSEVFK